MPVHQTRIAPEEYANSYIGRHGAVPPLLVLQLPVQLMTEVPQTPDKLHTEWASLATFWLVATSFQLGLSIDADFALDIIQP